ncbi:Oxidoreductase [Nitrospira tepida]|uniref:Oxidoreductase n=1 Tax=Nitrospira tepida TaxID=2973512 RepID=A0AA86T6S7_9BACT|nr:Gfo/Idh/MocA family oxidoreductase [Nitrospira tepida]CAI4032672.1 Oxidoreductase [Nitrospira tepida]
MQAAPPNESAARRPRIAVIGSGYWGKNLVRNMHDLQALEMICDTHDETLASLGAQYPSCRLVRAYSDVLRDKTIRGVMIATPAETHAGLVREALLAGKDVFVEKPLCLSVSEGRALVDLARHQNCILMVGHLLWYHPAVLRIQQLIGDGELGRIQYLYSNRLNLGKIRREENILWSFAPHDLSVILGLVKEMPDTVQAQGGNFLHPGIADVTTSLLSFKSGIRAHIFVSWLHPYKEQKLVVVGDRKMAVFDDTEKKDKLLLYPHSIDWKDNFPVPTKAEAQTVALDLREPLRTECEHFLDCIETRKTPRTDGEEGLRVLAVLQQCQEALERKQPPAPAAKAKPAYFAHASAFIDEGVDIGEGTSIWHTSHILKGTTIGRNCKIGQNVVVGPNVKVGEGVKIQNNVSVYEGVTLEDYVFCGPSMVFTNVFNPRSEIPRMNELRPTLVKRGATLGANCTIICGTTIGRYALVGAGAVVTREVPDHALVVGSPARVKGWMCRCGVKLRLKAGRAICEACRSVFRKTPHGVVPVSANAKHGER